MKGFLPRNWFKQDNQRSSLDTPDNFVASEYTILVVDDSRTQLFAMRKSLEAYGFKVTTAENGKHGILSARHNKPDLILMDIVMPEVNGFQATRYLTRHPDTAHIPIIIVSGSNQEADKAWGLKLGARDFVNKPVDTPLLLAKVLRQLHTVAKQATATPVVQQAV